MNKEPKLPSSAPVGLILVCLVWLIVTALVFLVWLRTAPPLRSFYLGTYFKTSLPSFDLGKHRKIVAYKVVMNGSYPAISTMQRADLPEDERHPSPSRTTRIGEYYSYPKEFHAWLKRYIYDGQSPTALLVWPASISGALFCFALVPALLYDASRALVRRNGLKLRGPELLSITQFNKRTKGGGVFFAIAPMENK